MHKEESKKIELHLGDVSLNKELGTYYIDMRPAIIHYTQNIYDGTFDKNGVPTIKNSKGELDYFPINIAQYGFMLHADFLETQDKKTLTTLNNCLAVLENIKEENKNYTVWYHHYHSDRYNLKAPWASAMAQGEVVSFYLRMHQILKKDSLLQTAQKAYQFLKIDYKDGGVRRRDEKGYLWFEEYPSDPPSYVLNGFIYTLFGLYDLYRVTKSNEVKQDIDQSIETLKNNLHRFDAGYWSNYDLYYKELVRYYYQKNVHIPQLQILYILTKEPIFDKYAKKWKKTLNPFNYLLVQLMYRIKPRYQRICKKK